MVDKIDNKLLKQQIDFFSQKLDMHTMNLNMVEEAIPSITK